MQKFAFDSAMLSSQMINGLKVVHSDSMLDTVMLIDSFCKKIKEKGLINNKFMFVFNKIRDNWKTGIYASEMNENWKEKYDILGK